MKPFTSISQMMERDGDSYLEHVTLAECKPIILNGKNWSLFLKIRLLAREINLAGEKTVNQLDTTSLHLNKLSKEIMVPVTVVACKNS